MNEISNYAYVHFGAPSYQEEHGHMGENLQESHCLSCSQKEPQQSGKQQHISINTVI